LLTLGKNEEWILQGKRKTYIKLWGKNLSLRSGMVKEARNWGIAEKRRKVIWAEGIYSEIKGRGTIKGSTDKDEFRIIVEIGTLLGSKIKGIRAKSPNLNLKALNRYKLC
jgi:hypothetical protein